MKIMGLDISLTGTGVVILDCPINSKVHPGDFTYLNTIDTKKLFGMQRCEYIRNQIDMVIKNYQPDIVIIEGYAYGAKGRAVYDLGEIGGIIRHLLYTNNINYKEVPPNSLKLFVTKDGRASKEDMMFTLENLYGKIFADDNQADAMGLALFGLYKLI